MLFNQHRQIMEKLAEIQKEIHAMATNTQAGLDALNQAESDLATDVAAETGADNQIIAALQAEQAQIAALQQQVAALNTEDPAVAAVAAQLETLAGTSKANAAAVAAALAPPATPAPPASSAPAGS